MSTSNSTSNCHYCGLVHTTLCPRVRRIEYWPDGITIREIEFVEPDEEVTLPKQSPTTDHAWKAYRGHGGAAMNDEELNKLLLRLKDCTSVFHVGGNDKYVDRVQIILLAEILLELRELKSAMEVTQ